MSSFPFPFRFLSPHTPLLPLLLFLTLSPSFSHLFDTYPYPQIEPYLQDRQSSSSCTVTFKGESLTFGACDSSGSFELFYNLSSSSSSSDVDSITTLFRAPTSTGYVSIAWGYTAMVSDGGRTGTHAVVASSAGGGTIQHYVMVGQSTFGVTPYSGGSTSPYSDLEVDVDGAGGYIAGLFTRPLGTDDEFELPILAPGESASYIWAVGELGQGADELAYHSTNKSTGTAVLPELTQIEVDLGVEATIEPTTFPSLSPSPSLSSSPSPSPSPSPLPSISPETGNIEREGNTDCAVTFKGVTETFDACAVDNEQLGSVRLFYSISSSSADESTGGGETEVDTLFQAPRNLGDGQYVSFGWGYSKMVGSIVILAYSNATNFGEVSVYSLTSQSPSGVNPTVPPSDIHSLEVEVTSSMLSARYKSAPGNATVPFIWARGGGSDSDGSQQEYHYASRGNGTVDFADLTAGIETSATPTYGRERAHSILMAVTWTILVPWAVLFMRFFKKFNPTTFNVHRLTNFTAAILTLVAFGLTVFTSLLVRDPHQIIGYIVVALAVLQVIGGAVRPGAQSRIRKTWYFLHFSFGSIAVALGFVNTFLGIRLGRFVAVNTYYILTACALAVFLIAYLAFSAMPKRFPIVQTQRNSPEGNVDDLEGDGQRLREGQEQDLNEQSY